jgi:predicted dienelactone hydrolase
MNGLMYSCFPRLSSLFILFLSMHLSSFGQLAKDRADIFDTGGKPPIPSGGDAIAVPVRAPIGYTVLQIRAVGLHGGSVMIPVAVWYPTTSPPNRFDYQYVTNHVFTEVAVDGEPAPGVYPLIVYSHGATGSGLCSAFVEESLARSGFIVAAPDHTDSTTLARILPEDNPVRNGIFRKLASLKYANEVRSDLLGENAVADRPEVSYRPAQVKATISAMLSNPRFSNHIDPKQIGLFGHSFGAWTTMMISGPVPEYGDPRVKAAVVLSAPVNHYVFSGAELARIHIPTMMMFGEKEVGEGRGDDRGLFYDRMTCPKYLLEIADADHFTFSGGVKEEYPTINEYLREDGRRAAITRYTVAFFKHYFGNDPAAAEQLNIRGSGIAGYIKNAP